MSSLNVIEILLKRGVVIPCPASVEIGNDVDPERIAPGVVIHSGCRIFGANTSIGPGSTLGAEAPVTLDTTQLGRNVALKGGYFSGATFLDGSNMGSGSHVRAGTLLEEEANGAHTVGLKQTILFPFATIGSLVNFCDALMSGGSSRKNHSEIGSSYIHFNFTPHQDKATPSLVGNVPKGVMLDQEPIFLGGQGGLVGPVRIAFGTVIPAGIICRQDIQQENTLYVAPLVESITTSRAFHVGAYRAIGRIVENNLVYIGNIQALKCWYEFVRKGRMSQDSFAAACYAGALQQLNVVINERVERLKELAGKMARSLEHAKRNTQLALPPELVRQQELLLSRWSELEFTLRQGPPTDAGIQERDRFLVAWEGLGPMPYLDAVRALPLDAKLAGTAWLKAVVESVSRLDRIVRE